MTRTTPSRWITLHLSHIFLTDARTFIISLYSFKILTIRPRVRRTGENSTSTRSPGRSRTKLVYGRASGMRDDFLLGFPV